jgi:hypothetical protein
MASLPSSPPVKEQIRPRTQRPRLIATLFLLLVLLVSFPALTSLIFKHLLIHRAAEQGVELRIGRVVLSLFQPTTLHNLEWKTAAASAGMTALRVERAEVAFTPWQGMHGRSWINSVTLDGVDAVTNLDAARDAARSETDEQEALATVIPKQLIIRNASLLITHPFGRIRLRNVTLTANENERGELHVGQLAFQGKGWRRAFAGLRGFTALAGQQLRIGDVTIAEQLRLERFALDLQKIAAGDLDATVGLAAFEGAIRAELRARSSGFEAGGSLSQVSIEQLSEFVGSRKNAGGNLRLARFSYRGGDTADAALSLRAEITGFRWGERQFDSLIVGATLVGNRLQIPELELNQAHNHLSLSGEMPIADWVQWWKSDFNFEISARLERLSELSTLFGPALAETSGRVTVDGSLRSQNNNLRGQLIASGSKLSVRGVTVGALDAAVRFLGNDLEITNFQLLNGDDFLRGRGSVNIRGGRRYNGELHSSVADIDRYRGLLPRAFHAVRGKMALDWWGDGTDNAHSGAFHCVLRDFVWAPEISPLKIEAEGTYSPADFYLRYVNAANRHVEISCHVAGSEQLLRLHDIRLKTGGGNLEGDVWLPIDVYAALRRFDFSRFNLDDSMRLELRAQRLQLESLLAGFDLPGKGVVDASVKGSGSLRAPQLEGVIKIENGSYAPHLNEISAEMNFSAQTATIAKFRARTRWGAMSVSGNASLADSLNPSLNLSMQFAEAPFELGPGMSISTAVDAAISGPLRSATVRANVIVLNANWEGTLRLDPLLNERPMFTMSMTPFRNWQLHAQCLTPKPIALDGGGHLGVSLRLNGPAAAPEDNGAITLQNCSARLHGEQLNIVSGAIYFSATETPAIFLHTQSGELISGMGDEIQRIAAQFPAQDLSRLRHGSENWTTAMHALPDASFETQAFRLKTIN